MWFTLLSLEVIETEVSWMQLTVLESSVDQIVPTPKKVKLIPSCQYL